MASQLYMEWVKQEGGQYVTTDTINPFGDNYVKIGFKSNYTPTNEISQRLISIVENTSNTGDSLRFKNFTFTLGTGSSNANTESGFDDWNLAQQQELYGYGYDIDEIHTGGQFLKVVSGSSLNGIPYAFHAPNNMSNYEYINDDQFILSPSNVIEYELNADTNLVEYIIFNVDNNFWSNLFIAQEDLSNSYLNLDTDINFTYNGIESEYIDTISGGTGWGNSPYNIPEIQGGILQIPYPVLRGRKIGIGFSVLMSPSEGNVLTGDFTKSIGDYTHDRVNIQTNLQIGETQAANLTPSIYSFNLDEQVAIGNIANGNIEMRFGDYAGSVNVFVFDRGDFDIDGNPDSQDENLQSLLPTLENIGFNYIDDSAKYGVVDFDNGSLYGTQIQVSQGQTINIPFAYSSYVTGQDSFTIYVVYGEMDSSLPEEWLEYFNNLETWEKWFIVQNCNINSIQEQEIVEDEDVYTPPATGINYEPSEDGVVIENPIDVMFHLSEQELGYDKPINADKIEEARGNHFNWRLGFSVNDVIEGKKLLSEISKSSKSIPLFSNDRLSFFNLKNTYSGLEQIGLIEEKDILSYSFNRSSIDDVKTKIDYNYKKDYGMDKHTEDYQIKSDDIYTYYVTRRFGELEDFEYTDEDKVNYYGIKFNKTTLLIDHEDTTEVIEDDYIRDLETAQKGAEFMLGWSCNVHNEVSIQLPLKYYNLELGDLIEFDKMILDKKLYGENYVLENQEDMPIRCGQYILPLFIIHNIKKDLKGIKIEATQLHHIGSSTLVWRDWQYPAVKDLLTPIVSGDIDNDGEITVLDIIILVNMILEGDVEYFETADFNHDGLIDILDVVGMVNYIIDGDPTVMSEKPWWWYQRRYPKKMGDKITE